MRYAEHGNRRLSNQMRSVEGFEPHMQRLLLIGVLCLLNASARSEDALDLFLSNNPVAVATEAFKAGDHRQLVVPVCRPRIDEAMPGWPLSGPTPPAFWTALEKAQRPFRCDDLGEDADESNQMRLLQYAEQYNRTLLELDR
jgi:hypothetical protein